VPSPVCNMDEGMDNKCPALYVTWMELDGVVQPNRAQSCMQGTWGLSRKWGDPKNGAVEGEMTVPKPVIFLSAGEHSPSLHRGDIRASEQDEVCAAEFQQIL
jgi:hypothetical protein